MRKLCTYSFQSTLLHLIYCQYQGMNYEMDTNISLSLSEGDLEIVSYIYTKTSPIVWINTPKKIVLKIQEMNSLAWNIHSQTFSWKLHWVQNHPTIPVCYQPKNNQTFWYFIHDKDLDSHLIFVIGTESNFYVHLMTSLIPRAFSNHKWANFC